MIIAFTGLDGSGKSLQAKALACSLRQERLPSRYVWSRWSPLLIRPVISLGRLFFHRRQISDEDRYRTLQCGKRRLFRRRMVAQIWQTLAFLDYSLQVWAKITLPSRGNSIVVCDRYVHDLLVDLGNNFGYSGEELIQLCGSRWLWLFPKPDLTFLLDIPAEVAFGRKEDVPLSYLRDRRALYLSLSRIHGVEVLDATASIPELQKVIHKKTLDFLNRGGVKESPRKF